MLELVRTAVATALPLLRLMHLRVPALLTVFGRGRCVNQGRVYNRAPGDAYALRLQVQIHSPQNLFSQMVLFQQMTELAHRRLVRYWLGSQVNPRKLPQRRRAPQRGVVVRGSARHRCFGEVNICNSEGKRRRTKLADEPSEESVALHLHQGAVTCGNATAKTHPGRSTSRVLSGNPVPPQNPARRCRPRATLPVKPWPPPFLRWPADRRR